MEKKMETLGPFKGISRLIQGFYRVDNGEYRDNEKENGNYRDYRGYMGVI